MIINIITDQTFFWTLKISVSAKNIWKNEQILLVITIPKLGILAIFHLRSIYEKLTTYLFHGERQNTFPTRSVTKQDYWLSPF